MSDPFCFILDEVQLFQESLFLCAELRRMYRFQVIGYRDRQHLAVIEAADLPQTDAALQDAE